MNDLKKLHESLTRLLSLAEQDPENWTLRADLFDRALALGEIDLARAQAELALRAQPQDGPWRHRLAVTLLAQRRFPEAQAAFEALVASGIEDPAVRHNLAFALFSQELMVEAAATVEAFVSGGRDPSGAALALWLRCQHRLGRLAEGLAAFRREATEHAVSADACGVASLMAIDADNLEEARKLSEIALRERPDQLEALVAHGTVALADQQAGPALAAFELALGRNGSDGRSWSGLGTAKLLAGDLGAAQEAFRRAVTHMPGHVGTWIAFGWSLVLGGKVREAQEAFEAALRLDRNFPESHGALAVALARLGERERAEHEIEVARRLDPAGLSARYARAVLDGVADDPGAVLQLLQQIRTQRGGTGFQKAERILRGAAGH